MKSFKLIMEEDDIPDLSGDEDQWEEMDDTPTSTECLFCTTVFPSVDLAITHCKDDHYLDFSVLKAKHNMDCYSYIKLVNYIKTEKPTPDVITSCASCIWADDKYLMPIKQDDWLLYDFESLSEGNSLIINGENNFPSDQSQLKRIIKLLKDQLADKDKYLELAREDIQKMKESMKKLVDLGEDSKDVVIVNCASKIQPEDDEGYFSSYAHFSIHYEMLSDKVRTEAYQKAILENSDIFRDKIVLDLGCGTGILSMFSATAGAKIVYAVDQSDIVCHAMDIIRENNLHHIIKVIKGKLEYLKLEEKVDIIVSEWMGYFLLFEGMLDSVIYARNNFLKPDGLLLPNKCNMSIVGNGDAETHRTFIQYWSDVYGYKMNCMKSEVIKEASVGVVNSNYIITDPYVIKEIDINTCGLDVMDFTSEFSLKVTKDGLLTSLVGYFDTFFDLPNSVYFSTGPNSKPTHWKQTVFYFKNCKEVKNGDILNGNIICNRNKADVRSLCVQIELFGENHKFLLN